MSKGYNEFDLSFRDRMKLQKETIGRLHGRKKAAHIWRYYRIPIMILVMAILTGIFLVSQAMESRYTEILYVGIVNDSEVETELMKDDILTLLGEGGRFETAQVDNALTFTEDGDNIYEANVRLLTYASIGEIDVLICSRRCFELIGGEYLDTDLAVDISEDNRLLEKYGIDASDDYIACAGTGIDNEENARRYLEYIRNNN